MPSLYVTYDSARKERRTMDINYLAGDWLLKLLLTAFIVGIWH
jgi:hypothetical protein